MSDPVQKEVSLYISPPSDRVAFPKFAQPLEIGYYSSDHKNVLHFDKRQLSIYSPPDDIGLLNLDLNDGYERLIEQKHRLPGCLDNLLRWILEQRRKIQENKSNEFTNPNLQLKDVIQGVDLVCWRGLFTKLAATRYEHRENWILGAVRFRGVLFLMEFETDEKKANNARMTERDKRMTYWGHRFEHYVSKWTKNDSATTGAVNCNEQFCVVFRTKLGSAVNDLKSREFRILYGAEIDCIDDRGRYIELKTSRVLSDWRQDRNFRRFKLMKWWLQSFLAGIDRVICGYRDDGGIVKNLTTYDVSDMPRMATDGIGKPPFWTGSNCMDFLYELLQFVDKNTPDPADPECLGEISVFEFRPQSKQVRMMNAHNYTSDQILPDWFVSAFGRA